MKKRILEITFTSFILLLASGCAGIKPFFYQTGNIPGLTAPYSARFKPAISNSDNYSYVPSSGVFHDEKKGILNLIKGQYKFSMSLPASMKFEF